MSSAQNVSARKPHTRVHNTLPTTRMDCVWMAIQTCPSCAFTPRKTRAAVTHRHPGMVAGAAGNENKSPTPLDLFDVVLQSPQGY